MERIEKQTRAKLAASPLQAQQAATELEIVGISAPSSRRASKERSSSIQPHDPINLGGCLEAAVHSQSSFWDASSAAVPDGQPSAADAPTESSDSFQAEGRAAIHDSEECLPEYVAKVSVLVPVSSEDLKGSALDRLMLYTHSSASLSVGDGFGSLGLGVANGCPASADSGRKSMEKKLLMLKQRRLDNSTRMVSVLHDVWLRPRSIQVYAHWALHTL